MAKELRFDVSALDRASQTFARMGAAVERFEKRLDRLDGKRVDVEVKVKTDEAEREVGRFATDLRRKVQAAVDNLPELEITADSSDTDRKLAEIRRRMQELADKRIGVDLSAEDAIAEAQALRRELEQLGRESPDVRVQADTAAAAAKLAEVDREVSRIDGRKAEVKIDVDKSISETLIQVAQLGRALTTLAVPAALVAGVPQIAALGAAAITASGALGLIPAVAGAAGLAAETLSVGLAHVSDALGDDDTPAKLKKVNEALAQLSPNARRAVEVIRGLKGAWADMGRTVQDRLFVGAAEQIQALSGIYLPILGDAMGRVAEHFNDAGTQVATFFRQSRTIADVRGMFSDFENTIEQLTPALAPLASVLVDVGSVGAGVLRDLAAGAEGVAQRFALFVSRARESGQLEGWIRGGVTALGQLAAIAGNAGSTVLSIFRAGGEAARDFLGDVERVTGAVADFFSSAQGQDILVAVFRTIDDTVAALLPGLRDLAVAVLSVIGMLGQSGAFGEFAATLSAIASAAAPLLTVLGALASVILPPLLSVARLLAPVLVPLALGFLAIKAAANGLNRFSDFTRGMSEARSRVAEALSPMRQLSGEMRVQTGLARSAGEEHARLSGALAGMAVSSNSAISAVGRLGTEMQASYRQASGAVQGFADRAGASANQAITSLGDRLAAGVSRGVEGVISGVSRAASAVASGARSIASGVQSAGSAIASGLRTALSTLRDLPQIADAAMARLRTSIYAGAVAVSDAVRSIPARVSSAIDALRSGISTGAGAVRSAMESVRSAIVTGASAAQAGLRQLASYASSAGQAIASGLRSGASAAASALRELPGQIASVGRAIGSGLQTGVATAVGALRQLPAAAASAGQALHTSLQTAVIYAQETLRQLPADAARAGQALASGIRSGVTSAGEAIRSFGSTVASGFRSAAESAASGLRSIPDVVRSSFSSLGSAVQAGITHLGNFAGAAAGAGRAVVTGLGNALLGTKVQTETFSGRMGGLIGFLGGPWGAALAAAGVALSIFGQHQEEAAEKAREHKAALDSINQTLDTFSGNITQATINEKAHQLQQDGSLDTLRKLGVNTADYTQASLGQADALDRVTGQLKAQTSAAIEASPIYQNNRDQLDKMGLSLEDVTLAAMGYAPAQDKVNAAVDRWGAASPTAYNDAKSLADGLESAGGDAADMAKKLGISVDEVRQMQDATRSAATASQDFSNSLKGLTPALSGIKDGVAPTTALANGLRDLAGSAGTAAQQAGQAAAKLGGVDAGAKAARDSMQQSRDAFVQAATSAGMTADQANALADQIGLIPAAAETNFRTNATGVAAEMNTLAAQIHSVPAGKDVHVQALTDDARANLTAMGFQVENLPDGTFKITANTDQARASLDAFEHGAQDRKADVRIGADHAPADQSLGAVLQAIASGQGTVMINGNPVPAQQALAFVMGAIGTAQGQVTINGQSAPAQQVLQSYLAAVNSGQGTVNINGNQVPADQVLQALIATTNSSTGTIKVDGDPALANGKTLSAVNQANGSVGTITIDGNPTTANGKTSAAVRFADGSRGTVTIDGNPNPANGQINATVTYANGRHGTVVISADASQAWGTINGIPRDIYIRAHVTASSNVNSAGGLAEGGIVPMASGGLTGRGARVVPLASGRVGWPETFDGHRLTPMNANRAAIVAPRTYRVVGDRAVSDELYLPLVRSSARSQSLLEVGAARMGRQLVPRGMKLVPGPAAQVAAMADGGMVTAATAILDRMRSGAPIAEDLTWRGAPAVVGRYNDQLLDQIGRANPRTWLEAYVRRNTTAVARPAVPPAAVSAAMRAQVQAVQIAQTARAGASGDAAGVAAAFRAEIRAQITAQTAALSRELRAVAWAAAHSPDVVGALDQLGGTLARNGSATARAAAARDLAELGGWG